MAVTFRLRQDMTGWIRDVVQQVGVLVIGQPLAAEPSGWFLPDSTLPDYQGYAELVATLREAIDQRGVSFIVLTGDVHWGRLAYWQSTLSPRPGAKLVEFVSSAIGRVAVRSILSSKFSVAKKEDITLPLASITPLLDGYDRHAAFATNENNLGLLRLYQPAGGPVTASFALWNLATVDLALNKWDAGPCWAVIPL